MHGCALEILEESNKKDVIATPVNDRENDLTLVGLVKCIVTVPFTLLC